MNEEKDAARRQAVEAAKRQFEKVVGEQLDRVGRMKKETGFVDYGKLGRIIIGICGGDGIGPTITGEARRVLETLLSDELRAGRVELRDIGGLTIENRVRAGKAIPDDVMAQLRQCHVILKGPTTTPARGDKWPNLESANVAMRRGLDLFANVRPVRVPSKGIDWCFFRENTEGAYTLGSEGVRVTDDLSFDFTVTTTQGTERIARLAFDYARRNGKKRVAVVTKANIVKATDGKFLSLCRRVAEDYPEIEVSSWFIDIATAKLIDENRRRDFQVFILPNLYGDIITDEAAEIQGGVGTAGSANIGRRYAMFEAIHGSAPRMVQEGRAQYADPSSMLRAAAMLLSHIGFGKKAEKLGRALDRCQFGERKLRVTGRADGATSRQFADYVLDTVVKL